MARDGINWQLLVLITIVAFALFPQLREGMAMMVYGEINTTEEAEVEIEPEPQEDMLACTVYDDGFKDDEKLFGNQQEADDWLKLAKENYPYKNLTMVCTK